MRHGFPANKQGRSISRPDWRNRCNLATRFRLGRWSWSAQAAQFGIKHLIGETIGIPSSAKPLTDLGLDKVDLICVGSAEVNFDGLPRPCIGWHFVGHLKKDPHPDRARNGHDRNPVKEKPVSTNTIESENSAGCASKVVQGQGRRH